MDPIAQILAGLALIAWGAGAAFLMMRPHTPDPWFYVMDLFWPIFVTLGAILIACGAHKAPDQGDGR